MEVLRLKIITRPRLQLCQAPGLDKEKEWTSNKTISLLGFGWYVLVWVGMGWHGLVWVGMGWYGLWVGMGQ